MTVTPKPRIIEIAGRRFVLEGDDYVQNLPDRFEPDLVSLMALLCEPDFRVIDIGANVGATALALSQICHQGKVAAVEPMPRTFEFLQRNIAPCKNIAAFNFALGSKAGSVTMQGASCNLSGSFVADQYQIRHSGHTATSVEVKMLDESFEQLSLDRLDFIKIDAEGFELEVLEGAQKVLDRQRPTVLLEMNHWCLNVFRHITIPEFRDRLLKIFPCLYAIDGTEYLDFSDPLNAHYIFHENLTKLKFFNLVAGFDSSRILSRLALLDRWRLLYIETNDAKAETQKLREELNESNLEENRSLALKVEQMKSSLSWRLTAPFRALNDALFLRRRSHHLDR
jgi:FkbM family methyltransferase